LGVVEFGQQLLLAGGQLGRNVDDNGDDVRASGSLLQVRYAVAGQLEVSAALGAGRDFHADFAVYGVDVDFGAKGSADHVDMLFAQDQVALAREFFVGFDTDVDVQIAFGPVGDGLAVFA
jgi:hypothetical protein